MRKTLLPLLSVFILAGCSVQMGNTPIKKVEEYFNKYQMLDSAILEDLDTVLTNDTSIDQDELEAYRTFMKKHYQDLKYEIKDETIDGDNAIVEVAITVRDYSNAIADADTYREENKDMTENKVTEDKLNTFSKYRLEELKKVNDEVTYTINVTLTKQGDKWVINQLSNEDLNKINGLYAG